jgi:hypothetical protein
MFDLHVRFYVLKFSCHCLFLHKHIAMTTLSEIMMSI